MPIIKKQDNNTREGSIPGLEVRDIVGAEQGTHALKIGEVTIAPNTRLPRHIHTNTEETMVVLEGTLDAVVGREKKTIGPGDTVLAPASTPAPISSSPSSNQVEPTRMVTPRLGW